MKKTKMLVAALTAAVMVMGSGYAYWTQTLTINNTVSTGYLDVQFVDYDTLDWDNVPRSDRVTVAEPVISSDGQNISFTVGNMYPGAGASLFFVVENTGTVDAKVQSVVASNIVNPALANGLDYRVDTAKVTKGKLTGVVYEEEYELGDIVADTPYALATALSNNDILKSITLQPGDKLEIVDSVGFLGLWEETQTPGFSVLMDKSISGSQFEDETTSFDLGITFTQSNAQPGDRGTGTP